MDAGAAGAAALMAVLNDAVRDFRAYGYEQYLAHRDFVRPRFEGLIPAATSPTVAVGVAYELRYDPPGVQPREAEMYLTLRLCDDAFVVAGDASFDDPQPDDFAGVTQRYLLELPEVRMTDLGECVAMIRRYTARMCAYTSFLDDVGVPRAS
ncbi:hypothetical protein [Wenjunlia vitaminophila]|nr:hypothetical protein [Wenjunlia vitaminophila]